MIQLMKFVKDIPWELARTYLRLDMDVIQNGFNELENKLTAGTGTVAAGAIQGDSGPQPRYVSNLGLNHAPLWDQIDLATDGVKNRLPFAHLPAASTDSLLVGRGEPTAGNFQEILLGSNLEMSGTTLNVTTSDETQDALTLAWLGL